MRLLMVVAMATGECKQRRQYLMTNTLRALWRLWSYFTGFTSHWDLIITHGAQRCQGVNEVVRVSVLKHQTQKTDH